MTDLPEPIRARLHAHPWADSVPRLVTYVRAQVRQLVWGGRRGGEMPQGKEAEDVVYGAIAKVLDGSRAWDPDREPDLDRHLRSVCDSELNHLAVGFENRRVTRESVMTPVWVEGEAAHPLETTVPSPLPGPSEALALREANAEAERFSAELLAFLADDPPLARAVALIVEGTAKPADIAASLGMSVDEVYNMRKRLQRRLTDFMTWWRHDQEQQHGGYS